METLKKLTPEINHINNLLKVLHYEVVSSGGDGDAMWYTRFYDIDDIQEIIIHYNEENNIGWEVERNGRSITWGIDQEWAIITDDIDEFNNSPDWIQMKIIY
jgi:hypothetical protein